MKLLLGSEMPIIKQRVTKLLHKPGMPMEVLGQWASDQVAECLEWCMVANKLSQEKAV